MNTTSAVSASSASVYASSSTTTVRKSSTTESTSSSGAKDTYTPSPEAAAAAASDSKATEKGTWAGFDKDAFESEMRDKLLSQIRGSQQTLRDAGVKFFGGEGLLYDLADAPTEEYTDEQMGVGQEWGADAASDRIVQFALAFRGSKGAAELTDEAFVEKIRDAIKEGFRLAKGDLGELPGPTGKLFNDTYQASMDKLDKALEEMKGGSEGTSTTVESSNTTVQASSSRSTSTFSVVA